MPPLDLNRRRDVSALFETAFPVWFRHFPVFFTLAIVVVAPFALLVDGLWAGTLGDLTPEETPVVPTIVSGVVGYLLVPTLVTAMHVVAVQDLGRGIEPTIGRSATAALRLALPAVLVATLYTVGTAIGFLFLIIPGVYLWIRWYFGLQAVVAEGQRGTAALTRSETLVSGNWWRVFGIIFLVGLLTGLFGLPLALVGLILAATGADVGVVVAVAQILWQALGVSFTALTTTLLYFDLRARRSEEPAESRFVLSPERPEPA